MGPGEEESTGQPELAALRERVEQLERERDLLHAVLKQAPIGLVVAGPDGRPSLLSDAVGREWHRPAGEGPEGYSHYAAYHADGRLYAPHEWPLARALSSGEFVRDEEVAFLGADGECGLMLISANRLHAPDGRCIGAVASCQDITERRGEELSLRRRHDDMGRQLRQSATELSGALRALTESEARFRQMAEALPQVFWMTTADRTQALYASPGYERLWGQPSDAFYRDPDSLLERIHPEDRSQVARALAALSDPRAGHESWAGEFRRLADDGSERWLRSHAFRIRDQRGELYRLCGITEDVTERRHAEQARRRLASIVEASDDAILSLSLDGIVRTWNAAAERTYGYGVGEMLGRSVRLLVPTDRAHEVDWLLERIRQGHGISRFETIRVRRDGTRIHVSLTHSPLRDEAGRVAGVSIISREITELRRLEREVLEIGEVERRRIGQDLHDSLGQDLTGVAFLVRALQQRLERAGRDADADAARRIAAEVARAIAQTRALARGLCPVDVQADGLMNALRVLAERTEQTLGAACRFECPRPVLLRNASAATQLYHVAQEAVTNAVRHGHARHITIQLEQRGGQARLAVEDDGAGMPPDVDPSKGMGLRTMAYRARIAGATLAIGPRDGGGTSVVCVFPVLDAGSSEPQARPSVTSEAAG